MPGGERPNRAIAGWDIPVPGSLPSRKALRVTLTLTRPFLLWLGFAIAILADNARRHGKGPATFVSRLSFIVTPSIGARGIRRLFDGDGIVTVRPEGLFDTNLAVAANGLARRGPDDGLPHPARRAVPPMILRAGP